MYDFPEYHIDTGTLYDLFPWKKVAGTHLALLRGISSVTRIPGILCRGVAQLVARTAGGREVASSSLVIPTMWYYSK